MNQLIEQCESTAGLLKLLAHPQRLQILCHLSDGERSVGEIEQLCGASQSAVSQFLGRMKSEGLLQARREGKYMYYRIGDAKVMKLMRAMHKIFCP